MGLVRCVDWFNNVEIKQSMSNRFWYLFRDGSVMFIISAQNCILASEVSLAELESVWDGLSKKKNCILAFTFWIFFYSHSHFLNTRSYVPFFFFTPWYKTIQFGFILCVFLAFGSITIIMHAVFLNLFSFTNVKG